MVNHRCPRCGRAWTPGEVTGLGILRSRSEAAGGPVVEFACPGCDARIRLIPHGQGRYAPAGEPPPPVAAAADRRPPWGEEEAERPPTPPPRRREAPPQRREKPPPPPPGPPPPRPREAPRAPDPPLDTVARALEILGIGTAATREEIERAYRERSRTCHPDKVAHLDVEFQELAHRKFRELKAAYDLLTG